MANQATHYIPALSFSLLTLLYDPLLRWGMREKVFKQRLIERSQIHAGQKVLDLGCGTGTLTVMLKQSAPAADITGLDGDPQVLSIARAKAAAAGISIQWDQGMAYDLPYPDNTFDLVFSCLVFHHLTSGDKVRALRNVHRSLRSRGTFHLLDFGPPFNTLTSMQTRVMHNLEEAADNFDGQLPEMLSEAGFDLPTAVEHRNTLFGPIWFYTAAKRQLQL